MRKTARAERVKKILQALEVYDIYGQSDPDLEDAIKDVLADIRHLCDLKDWSFWNLDRIAHRTYYLPETKGMSAEFDR